MRHLIAIVVFLCGLSAFAQQIRIRVNEPLEIPGSTLERGEYVLKLRPRAAQKYVSQMFDLVEVWDATESNRVAALYASPEVPAGSEPVQPQVTYYQAGGRNRALNAWCGAVAAYCERFVYPAGQADEIGRATEQVILSIPAEPLAAVEPPRSPAPERPSSADRTAAQLPRTAGYLPIAAWLGLVTLVGFLVLRLYRSERPAVSRVPEMELARKMAAIAYQSYKASRRT
jgi:hypothetical protein